MPLFALFLWGSYHGGVASEFFKHPALTALGTISFDVYLWQEPVHSLFVYAFGLRNTFTASTFMAYLVLLYTAAQLYATHVDEPFAAWLRKVRLGVRVRLRMRVWARARARARARTI